MLHSFKRQVVFFVPLLFMLLSTFGTTGVFLSYSVASAVSTVVTVVFLLAFRKRFGVMENGRAE